MNNTPKTAYQWLNQGYVPKEDARFYRIDKSYTNYKGEHVESNYYYCNQEDCELNTERASELIKSAPPLEECYTNGGTYDGRPWWIKRSEEQKTQWTKKQK